jgi:hypothetical protein
MSSALRAHVLDNVPVGQPISNVVYYRQYKTRSTRVDCSCPFCFPGCCRFLLSCLRPLFVTLILLSCNVRAAGICSFVKPGLAFEASTDPVDTSAQAALAPHQTTEQKKSADTTFMAMCRALPHCMSRTYRMILLIRFILYDFAKIIRTIRRPTTVLRVSV